MFDVVAFDADDTLWHNESFFFEAKERMITALTPYASADEITAEMVNLEEANTKVFGYGVKSFTLTMIDVATRVAGGAVPAEPIRDIVEFGKELLSHPVELLDGVEEVVTELATGNDLALITKGDLIHQEAKVAASGLEHHFDRVEIVADKQPDTYRRIIAEMGATPDRFVMVGNSLRSDVLPVLQAGAWAVHVPYHITWDHEVVEISDEHERLLQVSTIADVPEVLATTRSG